MQGRIVGACAAIVGALMTAASCWASPVLNDEWVGSWASSPQLVETQNRPPQPGLEGNTLRQIVHLTVGGTEIRVRLSNEFGAQVMSLASVHVAMAVESKALMIKGSPGSGAEGVVPTTGEIRRATDTEVTFGGKASVAVQPGAFILSDPIALAVKPSSDLAVTLVASKVPDGITGHPGSRATSFLAAGSQVSSPTLTDAVSFDHWYVLDGVDVKGSANRGAVVALGDSITDGRGSITNLNTRWADAFAKRLSADPATARIGVLNEGIGGNCILHGGLGPTALSRFDRDVIGQSGVKWVLIFEGVNDIGGARAAGVGTEAPTVADAVILALEQFILRAHTHGLRVYGGTITPFGHSGYDRPATEADRIKVNMWIRTSGKFDGVVDFDKAVRDPQSPTALDPAADSGDHLHLNSEGYKRMAAAIDLSFFVL